MSFFILGVNHKACPVAVREKLHFTDAMQLEAHKELAEGVVIREAVILSTCNRVEIYGEAEEVEDAKSALFRLLESYCGVAANLFEAYIYFYKDEEAIRHLYRVACGLDSLVVGENEILGQVRDGFRKAAEVGCVQSLLYRLMERALKVGKDVRHQTSINEGAVSIPSVAVELAQKIFGKLDREKVMMMGSGEMSLLTLKNLRNAGAEIAYVVSRTEDTGQEVAKEFGSTWLSMEGWQEHLQEVDIMITSTSATEILVELAAVQEAVQKRSHKPLFLIDIAVPRNMDPMINELDDVYLYNVDDLKSVSASNLRLRHREIEAAEKHVDAAVLHFQSWLQQLETRPTVERLEAYLNRVILEELNKLEKGVLNEEEKQQLCTKLRARLMHPTLEKIKEASRNGGVVRYLEALHSLYPLETEQEVEK